MLFERVINGASLAIDISKPNDVYFEDEFLVQKNIVGHQISPTDLCRLLSEESYTPLLLSWELLDKCSFSCPFCYIVGHSHRQIVRFDEMRSHIQEYVNRGLIYCILTGGEATLHPDFLEIYRFLKQSGVLVELYTNGSLLTEDHISLFKELPPYKIEVSIYGVTQMQFKTATGNAKFDYDVVLNNILALKGAGLDVVCKTPLNKATQSEFRQIQQWCNDNDLYFYYSTNVNEAYDGTSLDSFQVDDQLRLSYEVEKIVKIFNEFPIDQDISAPKGKACYTCSIRKYGAHINSAFELMPCSETHLAETKSSIVSEGLENSFAKYRGFVDKFIGKPITGCMSCEASAHCKMCSAAADPVRNTLGDIVDFKVPEGHCENERKKVLQINNLLLNSSYQI